MSESSPPISLPSPADQIAADFVDHLTGIQPGFVDGIYLTGSIPLHDFYPNKSDIDFIVLCKSLPDTQLFSQLHDIHKALAKPFTYPVLSGSYITTESIRTDRPDDIKALTYHEGRLRYGAFDMAPISLAELQSHAITLFGQPAGTLSISITREEVNQFLHHNINSYWTRWANQHASWFNKKLLLLVFPRFTEWSVLGVARQLCTLQTGTIVSKTEAGLFCLQHLPEQFHPVIKEALAIRKDNRSYPLIQSYAIRPSFNRAVQTLNCIHYIINQFNSNYQEREQSV